MKSNAKKSTTTSRTAAQAANQPFFAKAGGGNFFAPVNRAAVPSVQMKMAVNKPGDKFEQEADKMAGKVMRMPTPAASEPEEKVQRQEEEKLQKQENEEIQKAELPEKQLQKQEKEEIQKAELPQEPIQKQEDEEVQRKGNGTPVVNAGTQSAIRSKTTGGQPLSGDVRSFMEPRFNADFSNVRVHSDAESAGLSNQLSARAFTHQNHIFFGRDQYQPGTSEGKELLAHELTHTVQQGHSVQRSPQVIQRSASGRAAVPDWLSDLAGLINFADYIPGWTLMTVIIGFNPLTLADVPPTPQNFLRGFMGLTGPLGIMLYDKLNEKGLIDSAFAWLGEQISDLNLTWSRLRNALERAWDEARLVRLDALEYNRRVLERNLLPIWNDVNEFADRVISKTVELVRETMLTPLVDYIKGQTRAYPLLCVILGEDPVTKEPVDRTLYNIVSAFLMLTESGEEYLNKLNESGKLQELSDWLDAEIDKLNISVETITQAFSKAWDLLDINAVLHPIETFTNLYNIFSGPVTRLFNFVVNVAMKVLGLIKDWLLGLLKEYANRIPGYALLRVILGSDPLTGEAVPRTAENFILGFLSFVPEGQEKFRNLQESGAIDKAFAWLEKAINRLGLIGEALMNAFTQVWETFTINDLTNPVAAFERVVEIFTEPVRMIIDFAVEVGMKILEFIFEGVLGPTGARVLAILKRARSTFTKIIKGPVEFVGNLINAVKKGFNQFSGKILQHLQAGLIGWLTGTLGNAGIELPERFDFRGILSLVMQILGITWQRIRPKLVRRLGERAVSVLETGFEVVRILVTEGPSGLWERLVEHLGNLRDTVIDGIKNFVITRIVTAAVTRIATMLNPAGAVIQAILAIYNTIMFFVERIEQIVDLVEAVVNSIANIAEGKINDAANYVEQSMARTLPVIISFFARLIGLGNVSGAIQNILRRVHRRVDRAIDRVLDWIVRQARRLVRAGRGAMARVASWFRRRVPFRSADGRSHSLYFEGSDSNPRLMVRSDQEPLQDVARTGKFQGRDLDPEPLFMVRRSFGTLRRAVRRAATHRRNGNEVAARRCDQVVDRQLPRIKDALGQGAEMHHPKGDQGDPVLINWYKRETDYPRIFGKSPTEGFTRNILYAGRTSPTALSKRVRGEYFLGVGDTATRTGASTTSGAQFFTVPQIEAIWRQEEGEDRVGQSNTGEGNRQLPQAVSDPNGGTVQSVGSVRVPGETTQTTRNFGQHRTWDIDHVRDLNLGGSPGRDNLWPLSSSANRAASPQQNQEVIVRGERHRISGEWSFEPKLLNDPFFDGKYVTVRARSILRAQQGARRMLQGRSYDTAAFTGGQADPIPIAWLKRRSQYPTFQPVSIERTNSRNQRPNTRPYRIGERAPLRVNTNGTAYGSDFLHVAFENYEPWGATWQIRRSGDLREARDTERELDQAAQGASPEDRNRQEQRNVGERIRTGYRRRTGLGADRWTAPRVMERSRSGGERELLPLDRSSYLEADHVKDRNFGGLDQDNLWPLPGNRNQDANAVDNQYVAVQEDGKEEVKSLSSVSRSDLEVKVVHVVGIPSGAGAHGTTQERPAGYAELQRMAGTQSKAWNESSSDPHEREADLVADHVISGGREGTGTPALVDRISPKTTYPKLQSQQQGKTEAEESKLDLSKTGTPMERGIRSEMESRFGRDFSNIRIHNDSKSNEINSRIGARAFTKGHDIYFAQGQYNPSTTSGKHLLAHELTHTIQQGATVCQQNVPKTRLVDQVSNLDEKKKANGRKKEYPRLRINMKRQKGDGVDVKNEAADRNEIAQA
ncbi:MAG: DUF4157 domain-containing protein [Candidatus Electrothrix communis]|nr:MAG: DUF4157 domain-containing protein [Candidatus Electrothrix communis]